MFIEILKIVKTQCHSHFNYFIINLKPECVIKTKINRSCNDDHVC